MKFLLFYLVFSFFIIANSFSQKDSMLVHEENEVVLIQTIDQSLDKEKFGSLDETLEKKHGVGMIRRGNFGFEPVVNGVTSEKLTVSIDGMRIFGACTDKMDPATSYLSLNNVDSLRIGISSSSNDNGCNAGGCVSMSMCNASLAKTRKNLESKGFYGVNWESNGNVQNLFFGENLSKDNWGIRISGDYRKSNVYKDGEGQKVDFTQYNKFNAAFGAIRKIGESKTISLDYIFDRAWDMGYAGLPMDVGIAQGHIGSVKYEQTFSKKIKKIEAKIYANNIFHEMDDTKRTVIMHMDMPGWSKTSGAYFNSYFDFDSINTLRLKLDGFSNTQRAEMTMYPIGSAPMFMLTWPDIRRNSGGVFTEYQHLFSKKTTLKLGVRLDYIHTNLISDLGVNQIKIVEASPILSQKDTPFNTTISISKGTEIYNHSFVVGIGSRAPTPSERYGFYLFNNADGFDYIGNTRLNNEKALQLNYKYGLRFAFFDIDVSLFSYQFKDFIYARQDNNFSAMTIGANGVKIYEQFDKASIIGGNIGATFYLSDNFTLATNIKYIKGDIENHPMQMITPFTVLTSLSYAKKDFKVSLGQRAMGQQNRINTDYGEDISSGFTVFNFNTKYVLKLKKSKKIIFSAYVDNLLNKTYHEHLDWGNINRRGRSFGFGAVFHH